MDTLDHNFAEIAQLFFLLFVIPYIICICVELSSCEVRYMDYMTAKEAAQKWGISERRVQVLCKQGRIEGVARLGKSWAILINAKKPSDARRKSTS